MIERDEQFVDLYKRARLKDQLNYYGSRVKEFEEAKGQLNFVSSALFAVTAGLAALSAALGSDLGFVTATVSAIATAVAAYDGLYSFERISMLFGDASRELRRIDRELLKTDAPTSAIDELVGRTEAVLLAEQHQWGQLARKLAAPRNQRSSSPDAPDTDSA